MAIRHYLSPMLREGNYALSVVEDIALGLNLRGSGPPDYFGRFPLHRWQCMHEVRNDGTVHPVCLVEVEADDFTPFDEDPRLDPLPSKTSKRQAFTLLEKSAVDLALIRAGITPSREPNHIDDVYAEVRNHIRTDPRSVQAKGDGARA